MALPLSQIAMRLLHLPIPDELTITCTNFHVSEPGPLRTIDLSFARTINLTFVASRHSQQD